MQAKLLSVWIKTGNSIEHPQPQDSLLILHDGFDYIPNNRFCRIGSMHGGFSCLFVYLNQADSGAYPKAPLPVLVHGSR